ncbi:MAG: chemotaxis protein CheX [Desulfobacterales bacterium]|nr:MAG: chemotaxis protein CheX [Desulfobacterales bacterium]
MVMMDIEQAGGLTEGNLPFKNSISGVIGLAGTRKGVLAIHTPEAVAFAITSGFLGMEVTEVNADVEDAVGEVANMLGGNIKMFLTDKGRDIELSLPSIVKGEAYDFQPGGDVERIVVPFTCAAGDFFIEIQLEK